MNQPVKYIAEIHDVREVTLVAAADLEYWENRLQREHLFPQRVNGKAEVLLSAMASKWMGVPFRELCVSVAASLHENGVSLDGYFLAAAFNSSRFFAFCERTFFHTPYRHGVIDVVAEANATMDLRVGGDVVLQAQKSPAAAGGQPIDEQWEGKIFIPGERRNENSRNVFFAKLGGATEVFPFSQANDKFQLSPLNNSAVVQWLLDCRIEPKEWHIRRNATHARSKTYKMG